MRRRAPQFLAVIAAFLFFQTIGSSQATFRPTPEPIVTAENESWYLSGQPITFAGNLYHPTGPNIFFHPYEMVRSGDFNGVPLYVRPTMEPYSVVYVPLAGRIMKPYERRRAGDIAGTVGSTVPSFPVAHSADPSELSTIAQAAAPPTQIAPSIGTVPPVALSAPPAAATEPAATTGVVPPLGPLVSARKPEGLNGVFVEYRERRWFSNGPAVELDRTQFTPIGDYRGFSVYRKGNDERTIYIAVSKSAGELLTPYAARR
jgi:hypothetical protein